MHVYCVPTSIVSCAHTSSTESAIVRLMSTTVQFHSVSVCVIYVSRSDVQPNTSHSITCAVAISLVCLEHRVNIVSLTALCCPCAYTCVLNHCTHTHTPGTTIHTHPHQVHLEAAMPTHHGKKHGDHADDDTHGSSDLETHDDPDSVPRRPTVRHV